MSLARLRTVVSTNWLWEQISRTSKPTRALRVLDTSFSAKKEIDAYTEYYMQGHIPQSVFFDLWKCVESTEHIPRNLPDKNCFEDYAQTLGISPDTHIVAYDRSSPLSSYRTWWLFRLYGHQKISVLDGGLKKWVADGFETTIDEPEVEKTTDFKVKFNKSLMHSYEDMLEVLNTKKAQIMDARGLHEPSVHDAEKDGGSMPGAKHIDFKDLFKPEDGTIKEDKDLKDLFNSAGIDLAHPVVATCFLGSTACGLAAAAHMLGNENVPVYYGAWHEWKHRAPDHHKVRRPPPPPKEEESSENSRAKS